LHKAAYIIQNNSNLQCVLCPHNCIIKSGKVGICGVRRNSGNEIVTDVYNKISAMHNDPIEKKPLYHFFPGKNILSVGSIGCNLKCKFCQNWEISQTSCNEYNYLKSITVSDIIAEAKNDPNNAGIAYTYNEPTVWLEFMFDIAKEAKQSNLKNVMVTNGFINKEPLAELLTIIDAFSVDLKAFKESFYKAQTFSSLKPVKQAITTIAKSEKFIEITNLIIPGLNDKTQDFTELIKWIKNECGINTVLHISRFFPNYKMNISPTPEKTLLNFYNIAKNELNYVYLGNTNSKVGHDTFCPNCGRKVIKRMRYDTIVDGLDNAGNCLNCNFNILPPENYS